ncbi:thermonuclease family protein [uncultured Clostridium sp.]|uniref:thermonuclease family protein n=1 Tax=uncultured Clostridium sp. TaxID=59620 RepID=UPI0025D29672|nr:thermonuclease family protein [uncultured Clostridium sp.]
MSKKKYFYENVEIIKIIDVDTIDVGIDLGFDLWKNARIRFYGINAPEITGVEKPLGIIARDFLIKLTPVNSFIKLQTLGQDKFGRWLGIIYKDDLNVNEYLVKEGHAVEYMV